MTGCDRPGCWDRLMADSFGPNSPHLVVPVGGENAAPQSGGSSPPCDEMRSALAEAWDEGAAAPRMVDGSELPAIENPYRNES